MYVVCGVYGVCCVLLVLALCGVYGCVRVCCALCNLQLLLLVLANLIVFVIIIIIVVIIIVIIIVFMVIIIVCIVIVDFFFLCVVLFSRIRWPESGDSQLQCSQTRWRIGPSQKEECLQLKDTGMSWLGRICGLCEI